MNNPYPRATGCALVFGASAALTTFLNEGYNGYELTLAFTIAAFWGSFSASRYLSDIQKPEAVKYLGTPMGIALDLVAVAALSLVFPDILPETMFALIVSGLASGTLP